MKTNPLPLTTLTALLVLLSPTLSLPTSTTPTSTLDLDLNLHTLKLLPKPTALPPATSSAPPPPPPPTCVCTIVFGSKDTQTLLNVPIGSTNGITGQDAGKKACSATLLVGSGCAAAVSGESRDSCVKSQACAVS